MKLVDIHEAVKQVQSNNRVFVHGVSMTPIELLDALCARHEELTDVELVHIHTEGALAYANEAHYPHLRSNACFVGKNLRGALNEGYGDYIPIFLSEISGLFRKGYLPIDVAFIHASLPDKHGYCSLGTSLDVVLGALDSAKVVVALLNPRVPKMQGDAFIHQSKIDFGVAIDRPLIAVPNPEINEIDRAIANHVAALIEDKSCLQMGIGAIPNAVLEALIHHKGLGVHTEMFSDGVMDLIARGVITGEHKKVIPGKVVTSFIAGTQALFDFVHDNPVIEMKSCDFTNDTSIIRRNKRTVAINSAIEIDLTGQICADTIGEYQYSGVGGQLDFIRGAALSDEGKAIIALASQTHKGQSKIVPTLKIGADVTTTRAHVHFVVTEFGSADLHGKNLRQRAKALIHLAHPDHREDLERAAFERFRHF